ncbi:hypothetical protein AVEN_232798-1 [Araneus ventricosus]|uniref:Uncharacterized protein n=1 Tax=Araneus ventricosus TaxID=182803 RepID=A0A4Y2HBF2_ARAVE|nr:hypothetical protein AVEN_232798-1 [Araneus ventricosus]
MVAQFWSSLNVAGNVCTYIASVYTRIGRQGGFSYQKASKEENLRGLLKKGSVSRHLNIGRSDDKGQTKMTLHSIWKCGKMFRMCLFSLQSILNCLDYVFKVI